MRILITEEALQSGTGHWPSYIGDIAAALRSSGDDVDVATHRAATGNVLTRVGGTPWFSRNCWVDPRSQGGVGGILHNFGFKKEVLSWLAGHAPYDWICALTMRLQHLLAFALLARSGAVPKKTRFFLLFVQGFGRYAGHGKPTEFPENLSTKLARFSFSLMSGSVQSGRVILAAETKGMQDELQRFTGLPVTLAPHPVEFQLSRESRDASRDGRSEPELQSDSSFRSQVGLPGRYSVSVASGLDFDPSSSPSVHPVHPVAASGSGSRPSTLDPRPSTQPITFTITCPGFARHEKGTDLFQEAIRILLARPDADDFRFVLQWPEPFAMPDGTMLGPDPSLVEDPRVEFLNQNLNSEEYASLLARTDLIVLPYRRKSYHHRVSRVAIEAEKMGIPIIYTEGTWSGEVADLSGCGVQIAEERPDSVADAIVKAVAEFPFLKEKARNGAASVSAFHSVATLRKILQNE